MSPILCRRRCSDLWRSVTQPSLGCGALGPRVGAERSDRARAEAGGEGLAEREAGRDQRLICFGATEFRAASLCELD